MKEHKISNHEARALIWWASVGFQNSRGGSLQDIPDVAQAVAKRFGISYRAKDFQKGTRQVYWFTPKTANALWELAVGRKATVPSSVKSTLYRSRKILLKRK